MIIALAGKARSGKDTFAKFVEGKYGADRVSKVQVAGPLKQFCREVFDWTEEHTEGNLKEVPDPRFSAPCQECSQGEVTLRNRFFGCGPEVFDSSPCGACKGTGTRNVTPRRAMQTLGTEWSRPLDPTLWAKKAARQAACLDGPDRIVMITDCRFVEDVQQAKEAGALVVFVERDTEASSGHLSETTLYSSEFQELVDITLDNSGTLDELEQKVLDILEALWDSTPPPE